MQVLSNPDAPPRVHDWRDGTLEAFAGVIDEFGQACMVRFTGDLDATPVAQILVRRVA